MRIKGWTAALYVAAAVPVSGKDAPRVARPAQPLDPARWFGADNYPPSAIRAGQQGRVVAIVSVDATGHPTVCRIDISAGSPALEKGTCDIVLTRGQFEPARDAKGRAIAGETILPVRWVLPEDGDYRLPSGPNDFTSIMTIAADNTIIGCEVTVDGKPQPVEIPRCGGEGFDPVSARARVKVVGSFRMRFDSVVRNGDTPPPLPAAPVAGRLLSLHEAREAVDAEGVPTNCTMAISGELAEEWKAHPVPTACDAGQRFIPVRDKDGVSRPAQVLVASWVTLLPTAN